METQLEMIQKIYTVILGVPETDNKGMAGDMKEVKEHLKQLNGKVNTNTTWRKAMCWGFPILVGVVGYLFHLLFG